MAYLGIVLLHKHVFLSFHHFLGKYEPWLLSNLYMTKGCGNLQIKYQDRSKSNYKKGQTMNVSNA